MTETDKPAFVDVMARLAVSLREPAPDVVTMKTYFSALADLEIEFVTAAAARLMQTAAWFPKTSEWRAAAEQVARDRREAQRAFLRQLPAPLCRGCEDTGWARDDRGRVFRCDCATLRRLELLGRKPWPVRPAELTAPG